MLDAVEIELTIPWPLAVRHATECAPIEGDALGLASTGAVRVAGPQARPLLRILDARACGAGRAVAIILAQAFAERFASRPGRAAGACWGFCRGAGACWGGPAIAICLRCVAAGTRLTGLCAVSRRAVV